LLLWLHTHHTHHTELRKRVNMFVDSRSSTKVPYGLDNMFVDSRSSTKVPYGLDKVSPAYRASHRTVHKRAASTTKWHTPVLGTKKRV
jgi:hypothetical protein